MQVMAKKYTGRNLGNLFRPFQMPRERLQLRYWLRLGIFFVVTLGLALIVTPVLIGFMSMLTLLYAPCSQSHLTPVDYDLQAEVITISNSDGYRFQGYFIAGTNGATIIMPPPFASGKSVRLPEATILAKHGYAVLMFESRRCADAGPLSLGYREVDDVAAALDYLTTRSDVDSERIGIYGFSSAGATAVMAAARYPQLSAVVAEGGYGDFVNNAVGQDRRSDFLARNFIVLYRWGTYLSYRWIARLDIRMLSPVSVIDQISPRPILLIYGSREVSLAGGRQQQAAAGGENAELWIVPGAGHGNYLAIAPLAYEARVVAFFDEALSEKRR
jgi:dipeptidyl aminopeptidase/acylaminoacyl peptidase